MLVMTRRLPADDAAVVEFSLALTAEERTRSRHHFHIPDGPAIYLQLPRGTVLRDGDRLQTETGETQIQIQAKPEPVITVMATTTRDLLRAAYHLGNRHVALEIAPTYLRLSPDPVLEQMLHQMGLQTIAEVAPFQPEMGAYEGQHQLHRHPHNSHPHSH